MSHLVHAGRRRADKPAARDSAAVARVKGGPTTPSDTDLIPRKSIILNGLALAPRARPGSLSALV
jgi:hypothetical protein